MACSIKGCKSRRNQNESSKKTFFAVCASWHDILSSHTTKITKNSSVCELHFKPEDIIKEHAIVQTDGTVNHIHRKRALLKQGAVPSIFPSIPAPYCERLLDNITNYESVLGQNPSTSHAIKRTTQIKERCFIIEEEKTTFSIEEMNIARNIKVPTIYWLANISDSRMLWTCWTNDFSYALRHVCVTTNMKVQVFIGEKEIPFYPKMIVNMEEIKQILLTLQDYFPCAGVNDENRITNCCRGFVMKSRFGSTKKMRCLPCTKSWKMSLRKGHNVKSIQKLQNKHRKLQLLNSNFKRQEERLRSKISKLYNKIAHLKEECSRCNENVIREMIKELPQTQQLAVEACFAAAKCKNKKGMRYAIEWIYECILLRIKSTKTYNHLRSRNILTLPSVPATRHRADPPNRRLDKHRLPSSQRPHHAQ
ncbi:uncharacterized protein LOC143220123 [Lasioglossum baleicum]|uniref:uncharacterized protein LOC143220123 n=1 Tax=Lasioglossum baleicum TaxID=434251 RepID=UPI003FCE91FD